MEKKYFGTDGIRGLANKKITPDLAMRVGIATGIAFNNGGYRHRVVIGKDTRLSGYMIETALIAGFTAVGMDVFQLGPIPTPAVAMLTRSLRADLGIMISASHNPYHDNGIKIFSNDGYKLSDELEKQIEVLIDSDLSHQLATYELLGRAKRINGVHDRYIEFAKRTLPRHFSLDGMRIAIDCSNGAAYSTAPEALWELGAEIFSIGVSPNGTNINKECGSTDPKKLIAKVKEVRADIGIALDGDADRVLIIDENGQEINGDQLMATIACYWQQQEKLSKPGIVTTQMSNLGLERYLNSQSLAMERTDVGDRYVLQRMREKGYNVGGEQSGHIILSDYTTTGDGLVAALQILGMVRKENKSVSEICNRFEPLPQILKNIPLLNMKSFHDADIQQAIEKASQKLGKSGRLFVRPSGTEPLLRIMGEADDYQLIAPLIDELAETISKN